MSALSDLLAYEHQTQALASIAGRLGWDQETVMPKDAAEQRSEEFAAIESVLHARKTDPQVGAWLNQIDASAASDVEAAQLREIERRYHRTTKVPAKLAAALAKATSLGQGVWAQARANEDFGAFAPALKEIVTLRQEQAAALADGGDLYDALLDEYEPGTSGASLAAMFDAMRPRLVALADRTKARQRLRH